jgi:hypothetical protein
VRSPLLLGIAALTSATLFAQSAADSSAEGKAVAFTQRLLSAVSHRDIDALAAMFRFPVTVHAGSITLPIGSREALTKGFDTVFTPELGCALERSVAPAGGRAAPGDAVRKEGTGFTIGRGALVIQPSGDSFVVTRIDEPANAAPPAPRRPPQRVDVPSGQVQRAGNLAIGGADRYLVGVRSGDGVQARIERFQGRAIGVRIVDVKTGRVLSTGADSARVVSATASQPGDVAIDVTRLTFCEPAVSYLLTISKRK